MNVMKRKPQSIVRLFWTLWSSFENFSFICFLLLNRMAFSNFSVLRHGRIFKIWYVSVSPHLFISESEGVKKAIHSPIIGDRRITIHQIADILGISTGAVYSILYDQLCMTNVSSTWMLHLLTLDPRHKCVQAWQELSTHYPIEGNDFLFRIITDDQPESNNHPSNRTKFYTCMISVVGDLSI
jgi:hypothetical protein